MNIHSPRCRSDFSYPRFASITYGRPLGINDEDCSVTMPAEIHECPRFSHVDSNPSRPSICFSSYQRELNKLYMIASPILKTIFGALSISNVERLLDEKLVASVTEKLWAWWRSLPPHLVLDFNQDYDTNAAASSKAYRLQALALQLTFDNLLIILHRPFLAQQIDSLTRSWSGQAHAGSHSSPHLSGSTGSFPAHPVNHGVSQPNLPTPSPEQWWNAAVRTSRVTELPRLAQMATDSHLVAFMAINLFNAAIVMVIMALSDPLSNRAQEAKRTITRIFRLQELLGKRSALSMQSSFVLRKVVHMLLRREAEAMLAPVTSLQTNPSDRSARSPMPPNSASALISVEDTLRLRLDVPTDLTNHLTSDQEQVNVNRALRLSESLASIQRGNISIVRALQLN